MKEVHISVTLEVAEDGSCSIEGGSVIVLPDSGDVGEYNVVMDADEARDLFRKDSDGLLTVSVPQAIKVAE